MDFNGIREYCLSKKGVYEDFPFDSDTLVFRIGNKMFLLTDLSKKPFKITLKCDPYIALSLREKHKEINPGYHMNKKHWNTVDLEGDLSNELIEYMIDMSYELVLKGLPRYKQEDIKISLIK